MSLEVGRLATTDESGRRVYLYQPDYDGKWKRFRKRLYYFLIGIYLIIPWIYINGEQIVRFDIEHRVFHLFGLKLMAHNLPMLAFLFLSFAFLLAFVTARWGRVWCGHACPQTVFLDAVYRPIERFVEGGFTKRRDLDRAPWSGKKILIKGFKWLLFLLVSLHITHSFLGYFVGTHELVEISLQDPSKNWTLFTVMLFLTGILLFDFGWFREQFCIIACPYGRFQSVIMDDNSLVVGYDYNRGEPRRSPEINKDKEGDCIDCEKCVKVCPTGIDIRQGLQLECIACTACIDACDEIMAKVHKPSGLIRYTSQNELAKNEKRKWNTRQVIYLLILAIISGFLVRSLGHLRDIDLVFTRSGPPYTQTEEKVVSLYQLKIQRVGEEKRVIRFQAFSINTQEPVNIKMPFNPMTINKEIESVGLFFEANKNQFNMGKLPLRFVLEENKNNQWVKIKEMELNLAGPF